MKIYRYAPFKSDPLGHGGEKRAQQITELLDMMRINYEPLFLSSNYASSRIKRILTIPSSYKLIRFLNIPIKSLKQFWKLSNTIYFTKQQLKNIDSRSLIIYEHALALNWFIPIILKQQGHKIIAIPHNLETLVISQRSNLSYRPNPNGFFDEISVLKNSDIVLTISKEEEWLLNLFGINTTYFPFTPCIKEIESLKHICHIRKTRKSNKHILILGSYGNPPTRIGMIELLSNLNNAETLELIFNIAGFFTENISEEMKLPERFIIHGAVVVEKLYELYEDVDAVIIHQVPSTGSLTKIPELLKAGIPVIANNHAARNFFNIDGVTVYRSFNELNKILIGISEISNPMNFKEEVDIKNVQDKIKEVIFS